MSPLLANVYLHYVFDLWVDRWRRHHARGDVIIVRFADDFVVGFQHEEDARRFLDELRERFARFGLESAPGQDAADRVRAACRHRPAAAGSGQAGDVRLSGLHAHLRESPAAERFWVRRITIAKRMRAKLAEVKTSSRRRLHDAHPGAGSVAWQRAARARGLLRRARQHRRGIGLPVPGDPALATALRRRSQRGRINWARMGRSRLDGYPQVRVMHPFPNVRFAART